MTPNPKAVQLRTPLYGKCTTFLAKISGLPHHVVVDDFERINLVPEVYYGPWPKRMAAENAARIAARYRLSERDVFLFGKAVHVAFGYKLGLFHVTDTVHLLPHPSGLCRTWNDPIHRAMGGKLIRDAHERWRRA